MSLDVSLIAVRPVEVYARNITHNLNKMAEEAGIYQHLWRPEELGIETAHELIEPLAGGLARLLKDPDHYRKFDAANGWGVYDDFVPFVKQYLDACIANPDAKIEISR